MHLRWHIIRITFPSKISVKTMEKFEIGHSCMIGCDGQNASFFPLVLKSDRCRHLVFRVCLQMIAPGYYQAECSEKKPCKEGMYCNVLYCEKCHKLNVACSGKDQCCKGLICGFGRCEKKSKGDPGKKSNLCIKVSL